MADWTDERIAGRRLLRQVESAKEEDRAAVGDVAEAVGNLGHRSGDTARPEVVESIVEVPWQQGELVGGRVLVPVEVVRVATVEAIPVQRAIVVANCPINHHCPNEEVDVYPPVDHVDLGAGFSVGKLFGELSDHDGGRVFVFVGLQAIDELFGVSWRSVNVEGPHLFVEIAAAVVEVFASEATVDLFRQGEQSGELTVDLDTCMGRARDRYAHLTEQPVAEPLVHFGRVEILRMQLHLLDAVERVVTVFPVHLQLHRQLGASLRAARVERVRAIGAEQEGTN